MTKIHTNLTTEDYLIKAAKDKGFNISEILTKALQDKIESKKNINEALLKVKCIECAEFVDKGFVCNESGLAWCEKCHKDLNIHTKCAPYFKEEMPGQLMHFHHHFGKFTNDISGQTLKDIEQGNPEHLIE